MEDHRSKVCSSRQKTTNSQLTNHSLMTLGDVGIVATYRPNIATRAINDFSELSFSNRLCSQLWQLWKFLLLFKVFKQNPQNQQKNFSPRVMINISGTLLYYRQILLSCGKIMTSSNKSKKEPHSVMLVYFKFNS